jgi:hypothetical protein
VTSLDHLAQVLNDEQLGAVRGRVDLARTSAERLRKLTEDYRAYGVTLVVGAGTSMSAGVPGWNALLSRLLLQALSREVRIEEAAASPLAAVFGAALQETNPLVIARYAKQILGDALNARIRAALYERTAVSPLLGELARLTILNEGVRGVGEVLSYNYDTLLEDAIQQHGRIFTEVLPGRQPAGLGLRFIHVHGMLRRAPSDDEWVIFSEDDYHREYADPYSWSNVVQLHAFAQSRCVFVGLSMKDPNIRRLLEAAKSSAPRTHYAFLMRTRVAEVVEALGGEASAPLGAAEERIGLMCALADYAKDAALGDLGVQVIWFDRFEEVPEMIAKVRSGAGAG